jgi:tetratricopeptide (TPR) repeat protein
MRAAVVLGMACLLAAGCSHDKSASSPAAPPSADAPGRAELEQGRAAHRQAETRAARHGRNDQEVQAHYLRAVAGFTAAIDTAPQNPTAYAQRARSYLRLGRHAEAEADLARALELDPQLAEAYATRGRIRYEKGRIPQAIADFDRALDLDPANVFALNNRGIAHLRQNAIDRAETDFREAVSWDPAYYKAYYNLGNVQRRRGDAEAAIEFYTQTIDVNPEHVSAWKNRGNAHRDLKQFDQALADYDQGVALVPHDPDFYVLRATARMLRDLYEPQQQGVMLVAEEQRPAAEAALADLRQALALAPQDAGVRFRYGLLLRSCTHYDEAMAEFNTLLAGNESKADLIAQLGLTHQMAGRRDDAHRELSRAIALEPENPVFYQLRASLLLEQGAQAEAAADVAKAQQLEARSARAGGAGF